MIGLAPIDILKSINGFPGAWITMLSQNRYLYIVRVPTLVDDLDGPNVPDLPCRNGRRHARALGRDALDDLIAQRFVFPSVTWFFCALESLYHRLGLGTSSLLLRHLLQLCGFGVKPSLFSHFYFTQTSQAGLFVLQQSLLFYPIRFSQSGLLRLLGLERRGLLATPVYLSQSSVKLSQSSVILQPLLFQ